MSLIIEKVTGQDLNLGTGTTTVTNPGGGTLPATQISISTFGINGAAGAATTQSCITQTINAGQSVLLSAVITGVQFGDIILSAYSVSLGSCILAASCAGANSVSATIFNPTTQSTTVASGTLTLLALRPR